MVRCRSDVVAGVLTRAGRILRDAKHLGLVCCFAAGLMPQAMAAERRAPAEAKAPGVAAPSAQAGAQVYALRCSGCHGVDLKNTSGGQVFDLRKLRPEEHDRFVSSVTTGKDTMPSWYGILSAAEIDAIWAYIRATVDR